MIEDAKLNILLDHHAGSYYYLNNSKIVFSFGSSMILEARGLNKNAYFIDPKFENSSFFHKLEHLKDIISALEWFFCKVLCRSRFMSY